VPNARARMFASAIARARVGPLFRFFLCPSPHLRSALAFLVLLFTTCVKEQTHKRMRIQGVARLPRLAAAARKNDAPAAPPAPSRLSTAQPKTTPPSSDAVSTSQTPQSLCPFRPFNKVSDKATSFTRPLASERKKKRVGGGVLLSPPLPTQLSSADKIGAARPISGQARRKDGWVILRPAARAGFLRLPTAARDAIPQEGRGRRRRLSLLPSLNHHRLSTRSLQLTVAPLPRPWPSKPRAHSRRRKNRHHVAHAPRDRGRGRPGR
jgi:hypothetical protein